VLYSSARQILERLGEGDIVLDVGGWADPFWRADWVMDLRPYETRGLYERERWVDRGGRGPGGVERERFTADTWIQRDICDREPYPFGEDEIDFAICAQTLEDVRDPVWVCSEISRIARAGYIEVPSRLVEQTYGLHGAFAGWGHHRWLVDVVDGGIEFVFKWPGLHTRPSDCFPPEFERTLSEEERVQALWWTGTFEHRERIFLDMDSMYAYLAELVAATGAERPIPGRGSLARLRRRLRAALPTVPR